ncbi:MAG: DUF2752 domain-containing protein [Lachnospiraceae bacterium]|nr:DUF2752 domain-containing protein [Lachnospiraceae bacterium]
MNKVERDLYKIGLGFGAVGVVVLLLLWISGIDLTKWGRPCVFYRFTGCYCPGCGGTRAVMALVHGKIVTSFLYHPLVVYLAGIYLVFMTTNTLQLISHQHLKIAMRYHDIYLYLMVAIIFVNWVVQNIIIFMH